MNQSRCSMFVKPWLHLYLSYLLPYRLLCLNFIIYIVTFIFGDFNLTPFAFVVYFLRTDKDIHQLSHNYFLYTSKRRFLVATSLLLHWWASAFLSNIKAWWNFTLSSFPDAATWGHPPSLVHDYWGRIWTKDWIFTQDLGSTRGIGGSTSSILWLVC